MSKDHYVSKTYLKSFVITSSQKILTLNKRKNQTRARPVHPSKVCYRINGDRNDELVDSEAFSNFLVLFENNWSKEVEALKTEGFTSNNLFVFSGYMAALMISSPAYRRLNVQQFQVDQLKFVPSGECYLNNLSSGETFEINKIVKEGKLFFDSKGSEELIRAAKISEIYPQLNAFYYGSWKLLRNNGHELFVTSDTPLVFDPPRGDGPAEVYFPITPYLAICNTPNQRARDFDIQTTPGSKKYKEIETRLHYSKRLNRHMVSCAEKLIILSIDEPRINKLVQDYSNYRLEAINQNRRPIAFEPKTFDIDGLK